jgi:O-antigen ligase
MYAIAFTIVRNRRSAKILAGAILASCVVPVAVAWQQVLGHTLERGNNGFFRAHGTLVVVDAFGIFLALIITFATALALTRFSRWRWVLWIAAPCIIFALVNSYGRTGWIASSFGLVVLGGLRYRKLLVIIPILLVVLAVAVPSTTQRFQDLSTVGNSSGPSNTLSGRMSMWRDALPHLKSRPVIGIGFGSDAIANGKRQVANDYVRALVETGIPGFVVYLWVLISCLIAAYWGMELARFGDDPLMRALTLGSFAVVPAYMLVSLTANMMTQVVIAGMFWSMAAIGHAYLRRDWDGLRT